METAPVVETGASIDLNEVVLALSDALDLVGVDVVQHGKRVSFMAAETGKSAGLSREDLDDLYLAGLLHDAGVSSTRELATLLGGLDFEETADHAARGADLLGRFEPFARIAEIVRRHHDWWDAPRAPAAPPEIRLLANAIFLADRVDALMRFDSGRDILLRSRSIRRVVAGLAGTRFAPRLVDAFLDASDAEAFWLTLEPRHLDRYLADALAAGRPRPAPSRSLRSLAGIFAVIVDAKSPFTARHSEGVARLASLLGRLSGLPEAECERLEIAGLLHDLGKLGVPDEILDKNAPLDEAEFARIERHTFETWQILRRVASLREVAAWAADHHESLAGRGYPFRLSEGELPLQARIVAVADVYQALAQRRPYRDSLLPAEILGTLRTMVGGGKLDSVLVELLAKHAGLCHAAAVGPPAEPAVDGALGRSACELPGPA